MPCWSPISPALEATMAKPRPVVVARVWQDRKARIIEVRGKPANALITLVAAGGQGCTALEASDWAYHFAAYCYELRHRYGLASRRDAARYLGYQSKTLAMWTLKGKGPRSVPIGPPISTPGSTRTAAPRHQRRRGHDRALGAGQGRRMSAKSGVRVPPHQTPRILKKTTNQNNRLGHEK